ncbi:hypothetical protein ABH940_006230 [Streptacidiphilus sp. BW17]
MPIGSHQAKPTNFMTVPWARNCTTGAIDAYTFTTGTINTTDSFGNTVPVPVATAISGPTALTGTFTAAAYPKIGSEGALTGPTGIPDLWTLNTSGTVQEWNGTTSDGTANTAVTGFATTPATVGTTVSGTDEWLPNTSSSAGSPWADTAGLNPAAPTGTPTHGLITDSAGASMQAATFDGSTNYLSATKAVDTSHDYTISAWVNLNAGYNPSGYYTALCQRDTTGARCSAYLQYSAAFHGWALVAPNTDSAGASSYAHAGDNQTPKPGVWTQLVGVYSATNHTMTLYINGQIAGGGANTTPWTGSGPFLIGGADGGNTPGNIANFPGSIANVRTYQQALPQEQVSALYQQQSQYGLP